MALSGNIGVFAGTGAGARLTPQQVVDRLRGMGLDPDDFPSFEAARQRAEQGASGEGAQQGRLTQAPSRPGEPQLDAADAFLQRRQALRGEAPQDAPAPDVPRPSQTFFGPDTNDGFSLDAFRATNRAIDRTQAESSARIDAQSRAQSARSRAEGASRRAQSTARRRSTASTNTSRLIARGSADRARRSASAGQGPSGPPPSSAARAQAPRNVGATGSDIPPQIRAGAAGASASLRSLAGSGLGRFIRRGGVLSPALIEKQVSAAAGAAEAGLASAREDIQNRALQAGTFDEATIESQLQPLRQAALGAGDRARTAAELANAQTLVPIVGAQAQLAIERARLRGQEAQFAALGRFANG